LLFSLLHIHIQDIFLADQRVFLGQLYEVIATDPLSLLILASFFVHQVDPSAVSFQCRVTILDKDVELYKGHALVADFVDVLESQVRLLPLISTVLNRLQSNIQLEHTLVPVTLLVGEVNHGVKANVEE